MNARVAIFPSVLIAVLAICALGAVDPDYGRKIELKDVIVKNRCVEGEIKNAGAKTVLKVRVNFTCFDAKGQPIHEEEWDIFDAAIKKPLKPGYGIKFRHCLGDAPSTWKDQVKLAVVAVEVE